MTAAAAGGRPRVLVTRRLPATVEEALAGRFDTTLSAGDEPLQDPAFIAAARDMDALLCTVTDRLPPAMFDVEPRRLAVVANFGVGVDHIPLDRARERGVVVTNTPDVLTDDTADLTIALMLAAMRRLGEGERLVRAGGWRGWAPTHHLGTRVTGKTLGIVGYGRIGQAVGRRAHLGFGMRVLYHQRRPFAADAVDPAGAEFCASLESMLPRCDVLSLHCPATEATRRLLDAARLALLPAHAVLVNTARGEVVDEAALAAALREGRLAAAGLDVYSREPAVPESLLALENAVLLPHLGSATTETREAMGWRAVANLEAFFAGRAPPDRVA